MSTDLAAQMAELHALVRDLTDRVSVLEDHREIAALIASYGPAVDAAIPEAVGAVWTEDGVYDVDVVTLTGRGEIEAMVTGEMHQGFVRRGCAHVLEPADIRVAGDTAVATAKSMLVVAAPGGESFTVVRATANRWELDRVDGEWRCSRRIARVLDGRADARELLARGVRERP